MSSGIVPSIEYNEQIKRTVRETLRRSRSTEVQSGRWHKKGVIEYKIILDANVNGLADPLDVVNGSTDQDSPNATICDWDQANSKWVQTDRRLAVANDTEEDYATDDMAWAILKNGVFLIAGCPFSVTGRPTPPWDIEAPPP